MEDDKCAFSSPLIAASFTCAKARAIVRRGGADVACGDVLCRNRCEALFQRLKSVALPAFQVEDDLLSMPHSVVQKIQYGGLLGLQAGLNPDLNPGLNQGQDTVANIDDLVARLLTQYGAMEFIPVEKALDSMVAYKLRTNRGRGK